MEDCSSIIVSWDFSKGEDGKDHEVLIVGRQKGNRMEIVNAFQGEEAKRLYDMLVKEKLIKH